MDRAATEIELRSPSEQRSIGPSLAIVVPALNEEGSIGSTLERCLAAREEICRLGGVSRVDVIAISDGSTDRTPEIARSISDVSTIVFPVNRGYGAAIKEGWRSTDADFLAFLDADGTCDPIYFGEFCRLMREENADVVLGSRMGPDSKMPAVRRLGNDIFAFILGFVSGVHITDTASGMRVVRRSALKSLYPLPDGLHFTPAMSARALLNGLRVVEQPMKYSERVGRSKLSVLRDGIRFLRCIFESVLCYRPEKPLLLVAALFGLVAVLLIAYPFEFYARNQRLEEWMIFRVTAAFVSGFVALLLVQASALANRMASFGPRRTGVVPFWAGQIGKLLGGKALLVFASLCFLTALGVVSPGLIQLATTAKTDMHWSRLIVGGFLFLGAVQTCVFWLLGVVIDIWRDQRIAE